MQPIDFDKIVHDFLPPQLRGERMIAWCKVMASSIIDIQTQLKTMYDKILLDLAINVTTDTLQAHLRTKYPQIGGLNISILNQYTPTPIYGGYNLEHDAKGYIGYPNEAGHDVYIGYADEYRHLVDYIVEVPTARQPDEPDIIYILNKYKPVGKTYAINYI